MSKLATEISCAADDLVSTILTSNVDLSNQSSVVESISGIQCQTNDSFFWITQRLLCQTHSGHVVTGTI